SRIVIELLNLDPSKRPSAKAVLERFDMLKKTLHQKQTNNDNKDTSEMIITKTQKIIVKNNFQKKKQYTWIDGDEIVKLKPSSPSTLPSLDRNSFTRLVKNIRNSAKLVKNDLFLQKQPLT